MPRLAITADIGRFILAAKKKGDSNRAISAAVAAHFGVSLDQKSIGNYAKRTPKKPPKTASKKAATLPALKPTEPIDELARLDVAVRRIENLLLSTTDPREVAALSQELRQCLRALGRARKEQTDAAKATVKTAADLRAKLLAFAPPPAPEDEAPSSSADRSVVPDKLRTSSG